MWILKIDFRKNISTGIYSNTKVVTFSLRIFIIIFNFFVVFFFVVLIIMKNSWNNSFSFRIRWMKNKNYLTKNENHMLSIFVADQHRFVCIYEFHSFAFWRTQKYRKIICLSGHNAWVQIVVKIENFQNSKFEASFRWTFICVQIVKRVMKLNRYRTIILFFYYFLLPNEESYSIDALIFVNVGVIVWACVFLDEQICNVSNVSILVSFYYITLIPGDAHDCRKCAVWNCLA